MRELLDRADASDKPYDEVIRSLQEENSSLRRSLIEVQAKLARLVATMQSLSGTVSKALDDSDLGEPSHNATDLIEDCAPPNFGTDEVVLKEPDDLDFLEAQKINEVFENRATETESAQLPVIHVPGRESSPSANILESFNSLAQQIPSIWSFEYQMGQDTYSTAIMNSEESSLMLGKGWAESNSPFSDHISVLQRLMKSKIKLPGQTSSL